MTVTHRTVLNQIALGLNLSTKKTRKAKFLDEMERVVPWLALVQIVEPHRPWAKTGRPPLAVETMLRIHYLQQWFCLPDPAMEEALRDTPLFREFATIDQGVARLPDETTRRRDDDPALPSPAGASRPGAGHAAYRHGGGCHPDRRARPRTPLASVIRRCSRPRRATIATSA